MLKNLLRPVSGERGLGREEAALFGRQGVEQSPTLEEVEEDPRLSYCLHFLVENQLVAGCRMESSPRARRSVPIKKEKKVHFKKLKETSFGEG